MGDWGEIPVSDEQTNQLSTSLDSEVLILTAPTHIPSLVDFRVDNI
jgi:hypothetical protein